MTPKTAAILHLSRPPKAILSRGPDWGQLSKRVIAPAEAIDEMFKAPGISSLKSCGNQQNSRQRQCVPNVHPFNTQGLYPDVEMFLLPERVSMLASGLIRKEYMRVATAFFNLRNTAVYFGHCQVLALTCVTRSPNISPPVGAFTQFVGQTISHYRILEKLGGGGMGLVYPSDNQLNSFTGCTQMTLSKVLRDRALP